MPGDKGLFTLTDVDRMPRILALITSCFSLFKNPSACENEPSTDLHCLTLTGGLNIETRHQGL
jgi:hypothetical protein